MAEQAEAIVQSARAEHVRVAFSADLGPDLLVPWRHPTLTVVYTDVHPGVVTKELVEAEGRADASVITRWTRDPTLFAPAPPWLATVDGIPLSDPVQQWWDLLDLGGEDRREAAYRLREALLSRSLPRHSMTAPPVVLPSPFIRPSRTSTNAASKFQPRRPRDRRRCHTLAVP